MDNNQSSVSIVKALGWTISYFLLMVVASLLDIVIWRKTSLQIAPYLNLAVLSILSGLFLRKVYKNESFTISLQIHIKDILIACLCAVVFFLLLDNFLDPVFESVFPSSEVEYQEMLQSLKAQPIVTFFRVVLLSPVVEETLMRGFILTGMQKHYNTLIALIISTMLFGLLHFNMVQTLSAIISGFALGIIYIKTKNLSTCILTHALYNSISFFYILH
ncbi:CPBP family intramembrane metalloprotease [Listeria monocytogenes]|uniref:CPBP family intramembrane glutamic endopeptidase n=1 Tax=Bacilli TaxID=91061 RepID=UPI00083D6B47|nr:MULTISPECIES: type II CAAX endopeptidase family protein [Bacilli]EAC7426783.1 CPBP family intramembrane metalloprotease [Listeria monocytogenes]EAC7427204.1 CPBP family intramembrane metalloprotease [Listeria monocytogenes]EAD1751320.1 CPBP family intramembrane metalloprotease [Listeria monocytogenes]EAD1751426.1 CPBP family intramembrane metalloprotease [Listeria monocytogenes]EAE0534748.1 CPBP family intramembrane metalloprotease [Listeria monocytogenes]